MKVTAIDESYRNLSVVFIETNLILQSNLKLGEAQNIEIDAAGMRKMVREKYEADFGVRQQTYRQQCEKILAEAKRILAEAMRVSESAAAPAGGSSNESDDEQNN